MPKAAKSHSASIREWISRFPEGVYTTDGKVIFCQRCNQKVQCSQYFQLKQHDETAKHKANVNANALRQGTSKQQLLSASFSEAKNDDPFSEDLCDALVSANIPFFKLNNQSFNYFLTKYCGRKIPDESTLRKNYLKICFERTISRIREKIGDSYIWVSVDETTDSCGRYIANLLIGKLDTNRYHPPHLIAVKPLEHTNYDTIARFLNDNLQQLGISAEKLLLLVTDGARYMLKAGRALKVFYPNMLHVSCLCHALNRIAEEVRVNFNEVDTLISNTKKIFLKAPTRVAMYRELCPGLSLPPQPALTRWGTWLDAVLFYSQNYEQIKYVVNRLDPDDALSIRKSQECFNNPVLSQQLAYIRANYSIIPTSITKLEAQGLSLSEALDILAEVKTAIGIATGPIGDQVRLKLDKVLENNPDFGKLIDIAKVLTGGEAEIDMAPDKLASMKFAPMTSCDVERSFSVYKNVLADNRTSFTPENLEMYLICNCEKRN